MEQNLKTFAEVMVSPGFGWRRLCSFLRYAALPTEEMVNGEIVDRPGTGELAEATINGVRGTIPGHWWEHASGEHVENSILRFDHVALGEPAPIIAEQVTFGPRLVARLKLLSNPPLSEEVNNVSALPLSRDAAIKVLLRGGRRPGRGGNMTWKKFQQEVLSLMGRTERDALGCTVRHLRRLVGDLPPLVEQERKSAPR